jgi:ATP-dependent DNA helicase RecG
MTSSNVDQLLKSGESGRVEFKLASAKPADVAAAVCAFLNSDGGTVLVGAREDHSVDPIADASKHKQQMEKYLRAHITPSALWAIAVEPTPQGDVLLIEVPPGSDKPYVSSGAIYLRRGTSTTPAKADDVRRLVHRQYELPTRWERLLAAGLELDDLDADQVRTTAEVAQKTRNYAPGDSSDLLSVLSKLSVVQAGQLTNAADVLFARNPSSRLPQTRVRATSFTTDKGGDFMDNRLFEGNAFVLLDQIMAFVQQHVRVESTFRSDAAQRTDQPQYPFAALREGILNAIAHRDYSSYSGGLSVSVFPRRIEIWNSGELPTGLRLSDLKKDHPSRPHNPDIAHVLYLRGLIERVGRGTLKIIADCKAAGLPAPEWRQLADGVSLTLHGRKGGPKINRRQKALIERLQPGQMIRPGHYYEEHRGEVGQRQAQRDLSLLESAGLLRKDGEGPATIYIRTDADLP